MIRHLLTAALLLAPTLALAQAPNPYSGQPVAHPPADGATGVLAVPSPPLQPPATLAAGQTWTSPPIWIGVWSDLIAGATSDTVGAISIELDRYIASDGTGLLDQHTSASSTDRWASIATIDTVPFASAVLKITNNSGSTVAITAFQVAVARRGHS